MLFDDTYTTIKQATEALFKDRGSKFLAFTYPITNEQEVKKYLDTLRGLHPKANHHCYAYRLGIDRSQFRVNDDGEPSGSAGRPILNVLLSKDVTNILVVVVRYFGGTLLGVPGLINAYKSATIEALTGAELIQKTLNDLYEISFDFEAMNDVMRVVKEFGLKISNQTYDNRCTLTIEVRKAILNQVLTKMEKIDSINTKYLLTN
ncbi:YigZ family protein [Emticicia sp. BO119]|uniref:IMPACT family protein n=1 Tax=Emticicia sp. BO119 TaxID=2757768 RepID=UPI0015F0A018|nr:YigZ family protein [Emticicia sp. BO119]MBA4853253.1 YigZ family protein [Emticicia sp. BO119]